MKNKFFLMLILIIFFLSGCSVTNFESIEAETPGIWNHYFIYPFSWLLIFLANQMFGSFGISIIVVTLLIRFLLLPFTIKQTKSSIAIQKMKPELEKLQKRKDLQEDQQKYQQEILNLYQKHGTNPLGGCLPIFIQFPILMAFYFAIMRTEEIKDSLFLWVTLGQSDPLFLFPILAAITTYISTKVSMTNSTNQIKILLYIMPLMILVAAVGMPSALALYWIVGNIFVIIQSYFLLNKIKK